MKLLIVSRSLWIGLSIGGLAAALNEPTHLWVAYVCVALAAMTVLAISYWLEDR